MMEDQGAKEEREERNAIRLDMVGIGLPKIALEKDMINGGAYEVTTISFKVRNMTKGLQQELAAQSFGNKYGNLNLRLLEPSIYMVKEVNPETGEVSEPVESVDNPPEFSG